MKLPHLAISILGIATAVGAATLTCRVVILRFNPKPIATHKLNHKPSKATIGKWDAWRIARTLRELDLACPPLDLADLDAGDFIPEEVVPSWEPVEIEPGVTVATLEVPEIGNPAIGYALTPPFVPYGDAVPTPEPWTLGLVLLGVGGLYFCKLEVPSE